MDDKIILFDICDVLLKTSFQNVFRALFPNRADVPKIDKDFEYDQFSRGKLCAYDYYEHFIKRYELTINYDEFCWAWNQFFIGEMDGIESLLQSLSQKHQLCVLSNLNIIHCNFSRDKYHGIFRYFSKIYYSFELGLRKPEADIFLTTISLLKNPSDRIMLVDDKPKNVETARTLGMCAIHYRDVRSLEIELSKW